VRRRLERVLIVEDNAPLRSAIARVVRGWGAQPLGAATAAEAKALLSPPPDLIIIDIHLPDEPAFAVLEACSRVWPVPLKVAISGAATPEEAFRLAQLGVRAYLNKPLSIEELTAAVDTALREAPDLDPLIAEVVGHGPMRELQGRVRSVMVRQALALMEGSRSGAARLLDVSRQAVQQMLRGGRARPPAEPPEDDSGPSSTTISRPAS
jgi:DNA-binding response OmpR family regulator